MPGETEGAGPSERSGSSLRVKICGLTDAASTAVAVEAGASHVGFVLAESPRRLEASAAALLAAGVPDDVLTVAVFRTPTLREVLGALARFPADLVQCEVTREIREGVPSDRLLPVLHDGPDVVGEAEDVRKRIGRPGPMVLEAAGRGGRGVAPDHERAARVAEVVDVLLAGGLTPDNVEGAIRQVRPWGVDVSSGVESERGVKDADLIRAFVRAARQAVAG